MPNIFNASEIIDMGIEKEKKRRDFYGLAADSFTSADMKSLFKKLRDWEDEHIKRFIQIRNKVADMEIAETYAGEFNEYIKAMIDDMLYNQVSSEEFSKNVKSPLIAIQYGIAFEKDAILFFDELLNYMESPYRESIQELINEEKTHIIYLSELKKKYK